MTRPQTLNVMIHDSQQHHESPTISAAKQSARRLGFTEDEIQSEIDGMWWYEMHNRVYIRNAVERMQARLIEKTPNDVGVLMTRCVSFFLRSNGIDNIYFPSSTQNYELILEYDGLHFSFNLIKGKVYDILSGENFIDCTPRLLYS